MLYNCTHIATEGVKGLKVSRFTRTVNCCRCCEVVVKTTPWRHHSTSKVMNCVLPYICTSRVYGGANYLRDSANCHSCECCGFTTWLQTKADRERNAENIL